MVGSDNGGTCRVGHALELRLYLGGNGSFEEFWGGQ